MFSPWVLVAALGGSGDPAPSNEQHVELYTMEEGEHLFERFGHAAICVVHDRFPRRSRCYNYGTTDFGSPPQELGWDFLRGSARFWVSVWRPERMVRAYRKSDRTIWKQRLTLSPEQVEQIAEKLAFDAKKENREYIYHHFDDNCSTRVRDIIEDATGKLTPTKSAPHDATYREIGRHGLWEQPALFALAGVLVGRRADEQPSVYDAMFLPQVLRREVTDRFGVEPELVHRRTGRPLVGEPGAAWPWTLAAAGLLAGPAALGRAIGRIRAGAGAVSVILLGLVGVALWSVAAVSQVPELRANEALLLFVPFDLVWLGLDDRRRQLYARGRIVGALLVSALVAVSVLKQPLVAPALVVLLVFGSVARFRDPAAS